MDDTGEIEISDAIRNELHQVLVHELGAQEYDEHIAAGSKKGDNYLGVVYRVTGKSTKSEAENGESSISVILKIAPTNPARREAFSTHDVFLREILMYDKVLPMFRHFQESKGVIPVENGFFEYPKCYKTVRTEMEETLIFEDLKGDHFEMFDRFQSITIEHVRLIMRTLGKFHAVSFALRDQQPEKLKSFSKLQENFMREETDSVKAYLQSMVDKVFNSLNRKGDERLLETVKDLVQPGLFSIMKECVSGDLAEPYAVICHGDCWNNNILFKYDEVKKPIDVRFLDWQVSRYATPVTDLLYYIFCCTTKAFRDQYYDDIIRSYHESLSEMITSLGSDPATLFPFEALQNQLRRFGKFGLATTALMLPVVTIVPENIPDLDEMAESSKRGEPADESPFKSIEIVYNDRMRDVIIDLDRLGYL